MLAMYFALITMLPLCFIQMFSFGILMSSMLIRSLELPALRDEDITLSHTSQGEEEVQHGRPIYLSHGGGPVQLKLEPILGL